MSGKRNKPDPLFVHYGFDGGASCSAIVTIADESHLAVGTVQGKCTLFSPKTHMRTATLYEDRDNRSIVAVGQFSKGSLFVHIRAHAILILSADNISKDVGFQIVRTILTDFYGFCGACCNRMHLFYPLFQENRCLVSVAIDSSEQTVLVEPSANNCLMAIAASDNEYLACGFEDGNVKIMDTKNFAVTVEKKIFSGPILSCAVSGNKMAVSSVKPPLKMFDIEEKKIFDGKDVFFPQKAGGCSAVSFSRCGKKLASGYWDGSVRVHSVNTGAIRAVLCFHLETINSLHWDRIDDRRLLFVCSKDTKLSIWNLYGD